MELMAPAGSFESLQAAMNAGADSVYFGVTQLNMRARSSANFGLDDLREIVKRTRKRNVKSYLTLNTLLYQHDLKLMRMILDAARESGASAVIAADPAAIQYAYEISLPVHISVQMSVSNLESVKFYSKFADVIVLARELDLRMIRQIAEGIEEEDIRGPSGERIRLELFGHGALCIAVSGRCGMSLYTDNASASRGACKQNCRRNYIVKDIETGQELEIDNHYVMSPKDICTMPFLDEVATAGISVLKIEGRGRSPDYVDTVIRTYRQAVDDIAAGGFTAEKREQYMVNLEHVYNRGFSDGYYLGKTQQEWSGVSGSASAEEKVYVGSIKKYYPKAKVAQLDVRASELPVGSKIVITGQTTGVARGSITELQSEDDRPLELAEKNTLVTFPFETKVRPKDRLYMLVERTAKV